AGLRARRGRAARPRVVRRRLRSRRPPPQADRRDRAVRRDGTVGDASVKEDVYCFGGNPLDRASERRDDREWIGKLLDDPDTRIVALRDLKPFTRGGSVPALDWQPSAPWRDQIDAGATLIFLGLGDGRAHFAIDATGAAVAPDVDTELIDVRA